MSIVVTAYQWKWHYKYQDSNIEFYSSLARSSMAARPKESGVDPFSVDNYLLEVDNPVVVPRGSKIRLLFTSNDVIHSWWMPEHRGQCAELCGKDHGYMPIVVEVVEPEAFDAWVNSHDAEQ